MGASFQEKSVWVQFAAIGLCLGVYAVVAGRLLAGGVRSMTAYAALFMVAVAGMVVLMIAGYAAAAIGPKPEERDERDRLISLQAESRSSWVLAAGVLAAVTLMVMGVDNVWTANLLLLSLAASEMLGLVLRIVSYRRGA
jgi:archaellum biogenesis protein FlaJ (TadC family)